ncbi:hypothetical protein ACIQMO_07665 [Streptomyces sp. NPDC091406]|uniref:TRADD-N-associated membrane domain-containing protein n=1 Tax=unclassified Streptomyces TaxID=2593676 RepID=UPI0037FC13D8
MPIDAIAAVLTGIATLGVAYTTFRQARQSPKDFDQDLDEERKRLRERLTARELNVGGDLHIHTGSGTSSVEADDAGQLVDARAALQRIDDDRFAELLIDYYAYGLTQARSSFHTSQRFAGLGTVVLLFGIALAIWRSETTGDLYLGIVTSSVGAVIALIGQLFHRRADIALRHMTEQTEALREDMRTERSTEQAIMLLANVVDPDVKARLQAGLIMKLSGAELPALTTGMHLPPQRASEQREAKGSPGE